MPLNMSGDDYSKSSSSRTSDGDKYDLNLPEIGPGEEPLPHCPPNSEALANHIRLLLRSRPKLSVEERAARKNPEPFRI